MKEWTYYAGGRASLEASLAIARKHGVIWRGAHNVLGNLIAAVSHMRPGDVLHFVYRSAGECTYIFRAIIDEPQEPIDRAPALGTVRGPIAEALRAAGYPAAADRSVEVIHLRDLDESTAGTAIEPPRAPNTVQRGAPQPLLEGAP